MGIPVRIDALINRQVVESNRIEFKQDFNPDPIIRSICAFANDIDNMGGGYIIIGVGEENGSPKYPIAGIAQDRLDGIQKKLLQYCHSIEPLYEPIVEPVLYQGVYILVIWVPGGFGRPYKAPKEVTNKQSGKHYYIRKFSSSVAASDIEEKELFYASSTIPFDDRPNLAAELSDLDIGLLRAHLKEIGSDLYPYSLNMTAEQIADDMQLLDGPTERRKPRNVGLLMFSEKPERYFRYARIEVVDIPDPTGTNMVEKTFTGPIQRQLKDALQYLKNYVIKEVVLKKSDKAEADRICNYPYAAVEEILANAVYHRSYQINEPITVRITPKEMEITSFPGFDRSITDEQIARGDIRARIYRNRRIGDFLKELKLIEGRNTGFPNARKALQTNGSGNLFFEMNPERDFLSVRIPVHSYFLPKEPSSGKSAKKDEYRQAITRCLTETALTLTDLSRAMGYRSIPKKLSATVDEMVKRDLLRVVQDNRRTLYTANKKGTDQTDSAATANQSIQ